MPVSLTYISWQAGHGVLKGVHGLWIGCLTCWPRISVLSFCVDGREDRVFNGSRSGLPWHLSLEISILNGLLAGLFNYYSVILPSSNTLMEF
jgi:hypothetical protein